MTTGFDKFRLLGRTALITGAAGLLGTEHAAALLKSDATVVLTDIDRKALELARGALTRESDPSRVLIRVMDVCRPDQIRSVAEDLARAGMRIDVLVNNAALDPKVEAGTGVRESSRLESFALDQWNAQLAVGLTGAFLCAQCFGTAMARDGKGGVILNIASDLSVIAPDQRLYRKAGVEEESQPVKPVSYSVVKSGLVGLTRYLATYWADRGVRANALSPGGVSNEQGDEFLRRINTLIPLGRMATRDEYHAVIQFLCSDASAYLTGQNIVMDGGRSVW